jgi:hypothetical protein
MNRLTSSMVPVLGLLLVVAGCNGDPTDSLRGGPSRIDASPSQLFIELDQTKTVDVGAVDDQGNPLTFDYQVTNVGTGITVSRDSSFLPVFVNDSTLGVPSQAPIFRFKVTGTAYGASSFTVSAGGVDQVIPVQVTPVAGLAATFTPSATPALGDTVTITAPAGVTFTQTALLTLPGAPDSLNPRIVDRDPNGTFIRFLAPPNVNAPVTVTEVVSTSAPTLVLSPATTTLLQTPLIDTVDVTYSTAAPTMGQTVTATIQNPLIKFNPNVASTGLVRYGINFAGQLAGPLLGPDTTHLRLGSGPQAVVVAPDSGSLTFQAPPNANGVATVVSFVFPGGFSLTLPTRTGIVSTNIGTTLAATFSDSALNILQPVTITAPAGFKFANSVDSVTVTIGGLVSLNQSIGGGGTSISVIPLPGSVGPAEIVGIHPTAAPQFNVTMPTVHGVEVPPVTAQEGTDAIATAPSLTVPTAGNSFVLNDAGGFTGDGSACCFDGGVRFYKLTIAAPTTLTFTIDWFEGQDMGVYIMESDGATLIDAGDSSGEGPTGHPETVTVPFTPGTYFVGAVNFSATNPSIFQLTIHNP